MSNLSFVRHKGDGVTNQFALSVAGENIGYFRISDIHGYVDDKEVPITIDPNSPHIVRFTETPKLNADIFIRRQMPVKKTYADFERGNNFGHRQVNNTFVQQLYLTQELLDGFFPDGFYFKQDVDLGGHKIINLGDAIDDNDAVSKKVTDSLNKRLESLEHSVSGDSRFLPWSYNAAGGEDTLNPPYNFESARVFINGVRQRAGESFEIVGLTIMLAEPLEADDWVDVELGTEPPDFVAQDISNHVFKNYGADFWVTISERFSQVYMPRDFGAVGDGITDDTDALQKCLDAANPWTWQGSVKASWAYNAAKAIVFLGRGTYRITRPLVINPNACIMGLQRMGWWTTSYNTGGSIILADFVDKDAYCVTTANYDQNGVRQVNKDNYSRTNHDQVITTQANCITLKDFAILSKKSNVLKGGLNMGLAHECLVQGIHITGFMAGLNLSCSWGGRIVDCNIVGSSAAITLRNDITTYLIDNCYLTANRTNPNPDFDFPNFPNVDRRKETACIAGVYASPHVRDCVMEGAQNGVRLTNAIGCQIENNYMEAIRNYGYVYHTSSVRTQAGWFLCEGAAVAWVDGSIDNPYEFNMSGSTYKGRPQPFEVSIYTSIAVTGLKGMVLGSKYFNPKYVHYETLATSQKGIDIYLSSKGDDDNHGYDKKYPVKTIQEAFDRCVSGQHCTIHVPAGETVESKGSHRDGTASLYKNFEDFSVKFTTDGSSRGCLYFKKDDSNVVHSLMVQGSVRFDNIDIKVAVSSDTSYQAFITGVDQLDLTFNKCNISSDTAGSRSAITSTYGHPSITHIVARSTDFKDITICDIVYERYSSTMWSFNHVGCTFSNTELGDESLLIKAKPIA